MPSKSSKGSFLGFEIRPAEKPTGHGGLAAKQWSMLFDRVALVCRVKKLVPGEATVAHVWKGLNELKLLKPWMWDEYIMEAMRIVRQQGGWMGHE